MRIIILLIALTCSLFTVSGVDIQDLSYEDTYVPNRVLFKLLPVHRSVLVEMNGQQNNYRITDVQIQNLCLVHGAFSVKLLFPHHVGQSARTIDLSLVGEFQFSETVPVLAICRKLMATGFFEYVEPRMIFKPTANPRANLGDIKQGVEMLFEPNDSLFNNQWHLKKIKAIDAWNLEQGDTSILIGIVDSGVDYNHPDLASNIALNYADPINGVDDDGNGFVDDYYGWDFYHNENPKPAALLNFHGTAVAGVAAAVTNNGIGIAAPGFNSRILTIKVTSDDGGNNTYGYEGIVYAADRGCRVINCSWGGPFAGGKLLDDIVRYATYDRNALVIASAGNNDSPSSHYPSNTDLVLGIAATDSLDKKELYSNYNPAVDLSAPSTIWSTMPDKQYIDGAWGTSFSAPLVSGAAAILAAYAPSLNAIQLGERLRKTLNP